MPNISQHERTPDGKEEKAGAPSCLIAYGRENAAILQAAALKGKYIPLK